MELPDDADQSRESDRALEPYTQERELFFASDVVSSGPLNGRLSPVQHPLEGGEDTEAVILRQLEEAAMALRGVRHSEKAFSGGAYDARTGRSIRLVKTVWQLTCLRYNRTSSLCRS